MKRCELARLFVFIPTHTHLALLPQETGDNIIPKECRLLEIPHSRSLSPFPCRNVSASLCGSFLLPGPEEIQVAAAARPGGVADRAVRVSLGRAAGEAPGVGLRPRPAPPDPAGPGPSARPRAAPRPPSVQAAEIIAAKGAHVPGQNGELIPSQVRVLLEERDRRWNPFISEGLFISVFFIYAFQKVCCNLPFSNNDPGNGYFFTSLWDLQCTSCDKLCIHPECVEEKDQTTGDDNQHHGIGYTD